MIPNHPPPPPLPVCTWEAEITRTSWCTWNVRYSKGMWELQPTDLIFGTARRADRLAWRRLNRLRRKDERQAQSKRLT